MWYRRISPAEAVDTVRRSKAVFPLTPLTSFNLTSGIGREQIWINAGFHEQLLLFELCRYSPSEQEGIYVRWRQNLQRHLQGRG